MRASALFNLALLLLVSMPARAALGDDVSSVQSDRVQMRGKMARITRTQAFEVHEIEAGSGTMIREYVSLSGTVFGIAWSGPANPDLKQLLGSHYDELQQPSQARGARRGPISITQPGLVFQMTGHMRAFAGRAFIPQLLPSGVRADAIR